MLDIFLEEISATELLSQDDHQLMLLCLPIHLPWCICGIFSFSVKVEIKCQRTFMLPICPFNMLSLCLFLFWECLSPTVFFLFTLRCQGHMCVPPSMGLNTVLFCKKYPELQRYLLPSQSVSEDSKIIMLYFIIHS